MYRTRNKSIVLIKQRQPPPQLYKFTRQQQQPPEKSEKLGYFVRFFMIERRQAKR